MGNYLGSYITRAKTKVPRSTAGQHDKQSPITEVLATTARRKEGTRETVETIVAKWHCA